MNPYLIEHYNAYTHGKKRKKHWIEMVEEEALYHKMIQDSLKLQEAKLQVQTPQQQIQNTAIAPAAGGGIPPGDYWIDPDKYNDPRYYSDPYFKKVVLI